MNFATKRFAALSAAACSAALVLSACGGGTAGSTDDLPGYEIEGLDADLIQAAAEEGQVFLRTGAHTPGTLEQLEDDMMELFGIQLTVAREATSEVYSAVEAERESGNIQTDVVGLSDSTAFAQLASDGAVGDAEVPNRDLIPDEFDPDDTPYIPYSMTAIGVMYNTANTEPDSLPDTWEDFASTDLRVLTANPSASGTALGFYSSINEQYPTFIEDFGSTDPNVTDSALSLAQMVLTGEVDAAIPAVEGEVRTLAGEGEPLAVKFMEGPVPTNLSYLGTLAEAPNPNAAKLLVQYQLTEEFQMAIAENGRPVLEGVELGEGIEDLEGRFAPVLSETLEENADTARELFSANMS